MSKYGEVALMATGLVLWEPGTSPEVAWASAAERVFPASPSSREKGCPKGAFLGLCEEGLVSGVKSGNYTRSVLNKGYALKAVRHLRGRTELASDPHRLWALATDGKAIKPNSQMDVVIALWAEGLLR